MNTKTLKKIATKLIFITLICASICILLANSSLAMTASKGQGGVPVLDGQQTLCMQHGGQVRYSGSSENYDSISKKDVTFRRCDGDPGAPAGAASYPQYEQTGGGTLPPGLAYALSEGADYNSMQQQVWDSELNMPPSRASINNNIVMAGLNKNQSYVQRTANMYKKYGLAGLAVPAYGVSQLTTLKIDGLSQAQASILNQSGNDAEYINTASWSSGGNTVAGLAGGNEVTIQDGPAPLNTHVDAYGNYDEDIKTDGGVNLQNKTDVNGIVTKVNQATGEYIVGPFNMSYTVGGVDGTSFGGVSSMTVVGYNEAGAQVTSIPVSRVILRDMATGVFGSSVSPEYFEPDGTYKVDKSEQVYPTSGQDYNIVFKDPNAGIPADSPNRVVRIGIKITIQYLVCEGTYEQYTGYKNVLTWSGPSKVGTHQDTKYHWVEKEDEDGETKRELESYQVSDDNLAYKANESKVPQQTVMIPHVTRRTVTEEYEIGYGYLPMSIGGHVWEDGVATKESKADGVSNTTGNSVDKPLKNVKVTLHNSDGTVATLISNPNASGITTDQLMHRINPTYTDEKGNYLFEGIDAMKKYYVTFEYNGQVYMPTEYLNTAEKGYETVTSMLNADLYYKDEWKVSSKETEEVSQRKNYDERFKEIGSNPSNYKVNVVLQGAKNYLTSEGGTYYNVSFTQKDLMGYTLNENGKYIQTGTQLIDGYLYDETGSQTNTYKDGLISTRIREYILANKKFPDSATLNTIYTAIANGNERTWRMLQFIEDCYITSRTSGQGKGLDLYPVFDQFKINYNHNINSAGYKTAEEFQNGNYGMVADIFDGILYRPIYPGQFFVNAGLWRRQEFDTSLKKDLYRVVPKINNKTAVYKYDKRSDSEEFDDIHIRMSDYESYYGTGYTRSVYKSDYEYNAQAQNHPGSGLEIYAVYKLTLRNQSQTVMGQIKEVVDYYDKAYTYREDLSWVTYSKDGKSNSISDEEFYNAMAKEDVSEMKNAREIKSSTSSRYGDKTTSDISEMYNTIYIKGLEDKKLATGETAYIYLTFQVNKENGKVILDNENTSKQNLAEINGYTTYYRNNTNLPNGVKKTSEDIAGLLDKDSNPGNLVKADILDGAKYEKNFEDDTDRAKGLKILLEDDPRKLNGTVWEDKREQKSGDAIVGNGIRENDETKIAGVTVQLVEKTVDGKEYIWQETTTNSDGYYSFEGYIPGDYVVRFYYGNSQGTVKVNGNIDYQEGGQNIVSYNGQDFKSTTYQSGISQKGKTDKSGRYDAYGDEKNITAQNETGTYGYNIYEADNNKNNVSDAKDLWSVSADFERTFNPGVTINERKAIHGRQSVIDYSKENVTNHVAEVLASPYQTPTYNGTKYDQSAMEGLINELINNTYMTAETGVIVAEFEYDRQSSDGHEGENNGVVKNELQNYINGHYTIANVDLGLSERPKAGLEIDKSISNIKVVLSNNNVQFDAEKSEDNLIWKDHQEYNTSSKKKNGIYEDYYGDSTKNRYSFRTDGLADVLDTMDKGLIQITMDSELMHGVTINITYKVKIKNVSEVDYEGERFYYLADAKDAPQVTTTANQVVDYVSNNLQFDSNNSENTGWSVIEKNAILSTGLVNNNLSSNVNKLNNVIQTEGLNATLKPEESTPEKTLILSRAIAAENSNDDLTYSNIVEIVKTSNTVGRRMAFSVVGNQDPSSSKADEIDTSLAERVIVLPPFGDNSIIYYTIGVVVGIILIAGIVLVNKKVLKK